MSKHVVAGPHAGALRTMYVVDSTAGPFAAQVVNKRRSAFSAYLFQVIGDKELLYNFIKYPISSAAQPADDIRRFMDWWHNHKYENNDTMETDSHRHRSRSRSRSPP